MLRTSVVLVVMMLLLSPFGCAGKSSGKKASTDPSEPNFDASKTSAVVDNPYLTLAPGTYQVYRGDTEDGEERIEIFVSHVTRMVFGAECTVVVDRVFVDDEMVEETFDWFCQDTDGNVWYMGEESMEYEDGVLVSMDGSWEAGVDGALPGIVMKGSPTPGDSYRQEYYAGEAEDMGEVVALNVPVSLSGGVAYSCLQTREWTPLEPGVEEYKYYATGVGLVLEEKIDGSEQVELEETSLDTAVVIDPADFVGGVSHPYLTFTPGTVFTYEGETDEGDEQIVVTVTADTKVILGVVCMVVLDQAYVDGELVEETYDWFAQDVEGNVWYMGEDSKEIEDGVVVSTEGSWEAGVDGAVPGIIMKAVPRLGDTYRQEYYEGEAEDMGEIVGIDVPVTLSDGSTYTCLMTRDWTPLEPGNDEYKYYAPGVGLVLETPLDGSEAIELVDIDVP